jgi:hypothetical protein
MRRRSFFFSFRPSSALMVSRMKSGPPCGSKGQSVPNRTWLAAKTSCPQRMPLAQPLI